MARGESGKQQHRQRMQTLQHKTKQKVQYHLQRPYIEIDQFYHIIREFFLELLDKDYEPTYEEILQELEEIEHDYLDFSAKERARAERLLEELSHIEYSGQEPTQEDLQRILNEFHELAMEFTTYEEETVEHALKRGFVAIKEGDVHAAREQYTKAHSMFEKLGEKAKEQHVQELRELYSRLSQS